MTVENIKLLRMAEQITDNMNYTNDKDLVASRVAQHIDKFWDERMKRAFLSYAQSNGDVLSPELLLATSKLQ